MSCPGELLDPTDAERVRVIVRIVELLGYTRAVAGPDPRREALIIEYEKELQELAAKGDQP